MTAVFKKIKDLWAEVIFILSKFEEEFYKIEHGYKDADKQE